MDPMGGMDMGMMFDMEGVDQGMMMQEMLGAFSGEGPMDMGMMGMDPMGGMGMMDPMGGIHSWEPRVSTMDPMGGMGMGTRWVTWEWVWTHS